MNDYQMWMKCISVANRDQLKKIDEALGCSLPGETYQETAERLRESGEDDEAVDFYEFMEFRWFEVEE